MDAPACSTTSDAKLLQICCNFQKGFQQLIFSILSEDVHSVVRMPALSANQHQHNTIFTTQDNVTGLYVNVTGAVS